VVAGPDFDPDGIMAEDGRVNREQILRRAVLAGDEEAWRALYEGACDRLYAYILWRCGGLRDRAEELTQDTWLHAIRRVADFEPGRGPFIAWLRGIAANLLRNSLRRDARQRTLPLEQEPTTPAIRAEAERVAAALAALTPRYEAVLRAKYLDGLSVVAIAAETGETAKAVESLLSRARQAFREAYQELR
jgi:RNA polymerase sigma-70 factor, ECF subfamily